MKWLIFLMLSFVGCYEFHTTKCYPSGTYETTRCDNNGTNCHKVEVSLYRCY